jgi:hypothetical protein
VVKQIKGFGLVSKAPSKFFVVGEVIPATGVYQVFHGPHRLAHEVTLLGGETFPRCAMCKDDVHFKLVHAAPRIAHDPSFQIRLYEIPHPEQDEKIDVFPAAASA